MKIAFVKLDDENKKNIRILEEVIIEANRNRKKMETIKYKQKKVIKMQTKFEKMQKTQKMQKM